MAYFPYTIERDWDGRLEIAAVFYLYQGGTLTQSLSEAIDRITNCRLPPSRLLIVVPEYAQAQAQMDYANLDQNSKDRLRITSYIAILCFDLHGRLVGLPQELRREAGVPSWAASDRDLKEIAKQGVGQLVEDSGAVLNAPEGYCFRKPSNSRSGIFIRAGNMFKDPAALAVIHHLLLRVIPPKTRHLYIDSFTILPIALYHQSECKQWAAHRPGEVEPLGIVNFHSYDLDPGMRFPAHDYFVLISASTSGGLARALVDDHGANGGNIFHMLGISNKAGLEPSCLYFKSDVVAPSNSTLKEINIPGEEFTASHEEAKTVRITDAHIAKKEKTIYKDPFYGQALKIRLGGSYAQDYAPLGLLETNQDIGSGKFQEWLHEELDFAVPANTCRIIAVGGERSRKLARQACDFLAGRLRHDVVAHFFEEVEREPELLSREMSGTVLVVSDEEGPGDGLLACSRFLRPYDKLHRHYLIGHFFPESCASYKRISSNLRISGRGRKYGWSIFNYTPVGKKSLHSTWQVELSRLTAAADQGMLAHAPDCLGLKDRLASLQGSHLLGKSVFLPTISGTPLSLRADSVFFEKGYGDISQPTVYLMVSAALQRARDKVGGDDKPLTDDGLCFESNPFIDTLLDPNMFSRFNDGVIQSAFLRACSQDELNYSRSRTLSRHMAGVIRSMCLTAGIQNGEACLEMIFALATEKIRLEGADKREVERLIEADPALSVMAKIFRSKSTF